MMELCLILPEGNISNAKKKHLFMSRVLVCWMRTNCAEEYDHLEEVRGRSVPQQRDVFAAVLNLESLQSLHLFNS